ncbi:hypothetical protein GCM10009790_08660 [Georgenia ruanii]
MAAVGAATGLRDGRRRVTGTGRLRPVVGLNFSGVTDIRDFLRAPPPRALLQLRQWDCTSEVRAAG